MLKKKLKVVKIDRDKEKIVLEQEQSNLVLFWKKYNKLILIILFILSLTILLTSVIATIFNLSESSEPYIKNVSIDSNLGELNVTLDSSYIITDDTAVNSFNNNNIFKSNGEVLLVKKVETGSYVIMFYSDYTAVKVMKNNNLITRISAIENNKYGISDSGVINIKASISDVYLTNKKSFLWGDVYYYSDGSARVENSKIDLFVRNSKDISDNYISDNKVSYLKESKNIANKVVNYYYDGTIQVIDGNDKYIVRNSDDINDLNNIIYVNNNMASVREILNLDDGKIIEYYTDGGAIIYDGSRSISVRKSNSIIIKNNLIYEIIDSKYVSVSREDLNVIYFTNGSAVIVNYNGSKIYVHENSNIKYSNGIISRIDGVYEVLTDSRYDGNNKITCFETVSIVEIDDDIIIVNKDNVIYDSDGSFKEILDNIVDDDSNNIKIINSTNSKIKYRLVIEKSVRTNLDVEYIRYQLLVDNEYIEPARLDSKIWKRDNVFNSLMVSGENYILLERELEAYESDEIRVMFWIDYDSISNDMQDKYFYGTLKLYSWEEIDR